MSIVKRFDLKLNHTRLSEARARRSAWYAGRPVDHLPFEYIVPPPEGRIPTCSMEEIIADPDKAIEQQVARISWQSESFPDCDWLPTFSVIHLGQGIIPSMFGARQYIVDGVPPLTEGRILKSIDEAAGLPERIDPAYDGWGPKLKALCERFLDVADDQVPVLIADHQSPYGVATKLAGNEDLMLAMYDAPELVDRLMTICTDAIIDTARAMEEWLGPQHLVMNVAHPIPGEGGFVLYDDYISVISPSLHQRFCKPHNLRLYETFGRGHLHTCGPYFEGYIDAVLACDPISIDITSMRGLAQSREDMLTLRRITRERGVKLVGETTSHPVHRNQSETAIPPEEAFLRQMAEGGLLWRETGDVETGKMYARWAAAIPN